MATNAQKLLGRGEEPGDGARNTGHMPRKLKSAIMADPLVPQGLCTMNVGIDDNLDKKRSANIKESAPNEVMDTDIGPNCEYLDARPFDLMFMPTSDLVRTGFEGMLQNKPMAYASLNGQRIPNPSLLTDEAWQDMHKVIGASAIAYSWGIGKETPPSGGTLMIDGSYSIHCFSTDSFMPGDYVGARAFSHKPEVRKKEKENLRVASNANNPVDRLQPILYNIRPEHSIHTLHNAVSASFELQNEHMRDLTRLLDRNLYEREDERTRLALSLRGDAIWKALSFIYTLADAGMITINGPRATNPSELLSAYNDQKEFEEADMNEAASRYFTFENGQLVSREPMDSSQEMRIKYYKMLWLARKLGVTDDPQTAATMPPAQGVIESAMSRALNPFILYSHTRRSGDIGFAIPRTHMPSQYDSPDGLGMVFNTASFAGLMQEFQMAAGPAFAMAYVTCKERQDSQKIFMVLNRAHPNEKLDIVHINT